MVVKIAIIKSGNIGTSPVIDLLLDERADRPNIDEPRTSRRRCT